MLVYQRVMGLNGCFCIVFNHQQTSGMDIFGLNGDTIEVSSGNQTWLSGKIHSKWKLVAEKKKQYQWRLVIATFDYHLADFGEYQTIPQFWHIPKAWTWR